MIIVQISEPVHYTPSRVLTSFNVLATDPAGGERWYDVAFDSRISPQIALERLARRVPRGGAYLAR